MEQEQSDEFCGMRDGIVPKLRGHAFIDDRGAQHVFQYLILPSFTPPIAWDVFERHQRGREEDFVLVRSSWRSDLDLKKLDSPVERLRHPRPLVPTIEVHELSAASEELKTLVTELAAVNIPIGVPRSVLGIDGVTYEIAIAQPSHFFVAKCRLSWWLKPPDEWEELAAWIQRAEVLFESAWAARGSEPEKAEA